MKLSKNKVRGLAMLMLGSALFTSCVSNDDNDHQVPEDLANVAIANFSPNDKDLYFFWEDIVLNNTGIKFGKYNGYYNLEVGEFDFSIKNSNNETLNTTNLTLAKGKQYSIYAVNNYENIELISFEDNISAPQEGKMIIRFIQLSPDTPKVIAKFDDMEESLGAFEFKETNGFQEVLKTQSKKLYLIDYNSNDTILTKSINFGFQNAYTIVSKGLVQTEDGNLLLDIQTIPIVY